MNKLKVIATPLPLPEGLTYDDVAKHILDDKHKPLSGFYDSNIEQLCDQFYDEYTYAGKKDILYHVSMKVYTGTEEPQASETAEAIEFILQYHPKSGSVPTQLKKMLNTINNE